LIRGRGIGYIREAEPPFDSPLKEGGKRFLREAKPLFYSPKPTPFDGGSPL